jgi:hypothetical protein
VAASTDVEASDRGFSHTTFETLTAPTGECRLKVQGWPARILACVPARGLYFQTVLTGGTDELLAELLPVGECRIAGRLTLPGGTAVPRAGIIVSRQIDTVDMLVGTETGVTDDEGRFLLPGLLPFTRYRLTPVVGITHGPAKLVTTTPGATLEVELELPAAEAMLEGSVTDLDGKPLPGITIGYDYSEDELPDWKTTTTDASGGFLARQLLPGRYSLAVDQPGFEVWGSEAQAPARPCASCSGRRG